MGLMGRFNLRSTVALSALLLATGPGAAFADSNGVYDWSGFYVGGLVGSAKTESDADIGYTNDDGSPALGWTDEEFHGDVYNALQSLSVSTVEGSATNSPIPDLTDWATILSGDDADVIGTGLVGYNVQRDNLVFGGELRAAFGNFGASVSETLSTSGTTSGSVSFTNIVNGNSFTYSDPEDVLTSIVDPISNTEGAIAYTATYNQDASIDFNTHFDTMISPVARVGVAMNRVQFFAMGGPSFAKVRAGTSASVREYATNASVSQDSVTDTFSADKTYEFSGSNTRSNWGFTVGGGAEWAVTDNVVWRAEAEYHDLGSISATGVSEDTDATYTVKQKLDGYSISTGIIIRF